MDGYTPDQLDYMQVYEYAFDSAYQLAIRQGWPESTAEGYAYRIALKAVAK